MANLLANNFRFRRTYSKTPHVPVSNLISVQKESYDLFLQTNTPMEERKNVGVQAVFRSVFPIKDFSGKAELQFVSYELETPKYDVDECRERGMTFSAPLKVTVRLVVWEVDPETNRRKVYDMNESDVYFGEIPLMTENGTFIVNGTERVVVSQLHRSPGIFFDENPSKTGGAGKTICPSELLNEDEKQNKSMMEDVRASARKLAYSGHIVITQKGKRVDPSTAKGPIRLKLC